MAEESNRHNLYIVATPIGNLQDITIRAASTLLSVSYIFAESTSKASILINFIKQNFDNIKNEKEPKIISYSQEEEQTKLPYLIKILEESDAALISEAGTPLISDPGFVLVREAIKRNINIIPIPGASSPIVALSASGLATNKFIFIGYLPKQSSKAINTLTDIKKNKNELKSTVILFESPHRINETLKRIKDIFGDIEIVIAKELTKIHEEFMREKISILISRLEVKKARGEYVILF